MNSLLRFSTATLMAISALSAASLPANAAACRDAHGRFASCPGKVATQVPKARVAGQPVKRMATATPKRTVHATRAMSGATTGATKTASTHKS